MRLLIIGAMSGQIGAASQIAVARGAKVTHADDVEHGLNTLRNGQSADVIMIDTCLDIGALIKHLKSERINVPVVACGVEDSSEIAVKAIKAGAQEYVPLPPDAELIAAIFEAVAEENNAIIYGDPLMEQVLNLAAKVANSTASILVTGETGTGKEMIAQYIHQKSPRSTRPFIAVNCAAIPENLLESELFGYEKGAFTGAVARRIGKFEEANGGTLLLDEISEMDLRLQVKLLRAIQEREVDRIGGKKPIQVDVRIIATSNRKVEQEVANGNFREDLYFRLNVVTVELPRLADRPGDIKPLADHFIEKYAELNGLDSIKISSEALQLLTKYSWPGNVRELENVIHRSILLNDDGTISPGDIQLQSSTRIGSNAQPGGATDATKNISGMVGRTVAEVERDLIIDTLDHCLGNRTHAANILGISIRTLRNKLNLYNKDGHPIRTPGDDGARTST